PLPLTVLQRDVKEVYSAQTPYRAVAMYNIFLLERNPSEIMDLFEATAQKALDRMSSDYMKMCKQQGIKPVNEVKIYRFEELQKHAIEKLGENAVEKMIAEVLKKPDLDLREQSHAITDSLLNQCQELTPATILMYTPPFYPPVNSSDSKLVQGCIASIVQKAKQDFGFEVKQSHFFNGVSDLSYVNFQDHDAGWMTFERNTPVYGRSYEIPFQSMQLLHAPVMIVGPFGRDAHQRTERLHLRNAFEEMPVLLEHMIRSQFLKTE
ncbi:MAG TPA: amino acid degradation protein, partial [Planococcus sp. (in: firmicutes)]|nr:amino acid degradation protein [Planococcus sp. (in: firmicutes)]